MTNQCPLSRAACPECQSDINFKKTGKEFCNCKKCNWSCQNRCGKNQENTEEKA